MKVENPSPIPDLLPPPSTSPSSLLLPSSRSGAIAYENHAAGFTVRVNHLQCYAVSWMCVSQPIERIKPIPHPPSPPPLHPSPIHLTLQSDILYSLYFVFGLASEVALLWGVGDIGHVCAVRGWGEGRRGGVESGGELEREEEEEMERGGGRDGEGRRRWL